MYGKSIRMARLFNIETKRICVVPIDHGTTYGPIEGIKEPLKTVSKIISGGADALVIHKGLLRMIAEYPELSARGRYIMHLSASTALSPDLNYKVTVGTVEEAVSLGADGVSIHVNLGTPGEADMIKELGSVAKSCMEWGMPLMVMIYSHKVPQNHFYVAHAARLAQELGADIVKIDYPGSFENVESVIKGVSIPVVIAGGSKIDKPEELLRMISDSLSAGAAGVAIGRNIFQHKKPELITSVIRMMVHGKLQLQDCLDNLKTNSIKIS